jgi:hypothetical protein
MSGQWTVRSGDVPCGYDGATVPAGEPVYAMSGTMPRYRCVHHAPRPVDEAQVVAARQALETARTQQFHRVLREDAGIRGVHTADGPKPFHEVADRHPDVARLRDEDNR